MSPVAGDQSAQLPEIGDGLKGCFLSLHASPTRPGCERLVLKLQGAIYHVQRLAEALREGDEQTV